MTGVPAAASEGLRTGANVVQWTTELCVKISYFRSTRSISDSSWRVYGVGQMQRTECVVSVCLNKVRSLQEINAGRKALAAPRYCTYGKVPWIQYMYNNSSKLDTS